MSDPKYTEDQHVAILTDAVARETASLSSAMESLEARAEVLTTEKASAEDALTVAQNRIDVLESEKAAEVARADAAEKAHQDYLGEVDRTAKVEQAKAERVLAIKAADGTLEDDYFSAERIQRWAEMADDQFASLLTDLTEAAAKRKPAFLMTEEEKKKAAEADKESAAATRQTAAFKGGDSPTGVETSSLSGLFRATGKLPVAAH